jgi:predicted outer membrane repeat protein
MILLVILYNSSLNQATSEVYFIKTNSHHCGTMHPCLTLSQFAANSSHYLHFNSTVTLIFLPGTHHLNKVNLMLSNVESFTMKSDNSTAKIQCKKDMHIYFSQSRRIHITNLEFIGCPVALKHVAELVVKDSKFEGRDTKSETALELIETTAAQIINSTFDNITSEDSVLVSINSTVTIEASEFNGNSVTWDGVLAFANSTITLKTSKFDSNTAPNGGVLWSFDSTVTIEASKFCDNFSNKGSIFTSINSTIAIEVSEFDGNIGEDGGILSLSSSSVMIEGSKFDSNNAVNGGVLSSTSSTITVGDCNFTNNTSLGGTVIYAVQESRIQCHGCLLIDNNSADDYAVIYLTGSEFRVGNSSGKFTFSNNFGSILAFNSNMTFSGYAEFVNNQPSKIFTAFQEGGAITLFQSNVFFDGACNLEHNQAENGGAIHSTESKLYVSGNVTIAHNTAIGNGGGVYLSTSELNCQQESTFVLNNNVAVNKGGGLHAISSSFKASSIILELDVGPGDDNDKKLCRYVGTRMNFTNNKARFGGGLSLEENARLYILKYNQIRISYFYENDINTVLFIGNSAEYGGAVYVDDDTNSGTCVSDPKTECFFQVLALYTESHPFDLNPQGVYFSQNHASTSGSTLYGGLLDRCAVGQFAEMYMKYIRNDVDRGGGIAYFRNVSNITEVSISSGPVRICLCTDYILYDCTSQGHSDVKKGEMFPVSLVAVDQVGQPVSATVQASLSSAESGLAEGQLVKNMSAECTNLTFNVVSPHDSGALALYASDGPCRNVELSRATVEIHFLPCSCPIGLQVSRTKFNNTNCTCECHSDIIRYMEQCDTHTGLLVKKPQSRAWISYINDTNLTGYLVYPNCPLDYCLSTSPPIDLNQAHGADAQCAFNRSSLLCGSCQPGLSLSLGSSRCLSCPRYWPAMLAAITIAAILAGIALVSLLLVFNMTVAVGTLNGLIFYANVVYANKSILLPFQERNFVTVFISWLNLDLGIDTCYFPEMDTYIKTWLHLVFPAYVIFLVILVIVISSYSTKFSNLIGRKDPVATLSTLILLSYAKLLEVCFKSALSVIILDYPDGSSKFLWLPDATVEYLSGKHIPLFIAAVLILLVGLVYTALLFSWQCLFRLPKWRIFEWSRNPRILAFIETYHAPYTPKHRYWTGLLLIVRVVLYLAADPTVAFTAITFTVCCIFTLRQFFGSRLYRKWPVDVLETFFCSNILLFATFSWYSLDNPNSNRRAAAYTSVTITLFVLLLIILYHGYTYTNLFSKCKKTRPNPRQRHYSPPPINDDDSHVSDNRGELLDELDGPVKTNDYNTPLIDSVRMPQPTYSVVEVQKPRDLAAVDPNAP